MRHRIWMRFQEERDSLLAYRRFRINDIKAMTCFERGSVSEPEAGIHGESNPRGAAPLYTKEILFRLLQGPYGIALGQIAMEGNSTYRIRDAIGQIIRHRDQPLRIEDLAETARMSVSSFHRHFKEVTAMSPLQFQKQLRLQEARRLLLSEAADAADVAFRVGYESPSQFSREYARLFGYPPRTDIKRLQEKYEQSRNANNL